MGPGLPFQGEVKLIKLSPFWKDCEETKLVLWDMSTGPSPSLFWEAFGRVLKE